MVSEFLIIGPLDSWREMIEECTQVALGEKLLSHIGSSKLGVTGIFHPG